MDILFSEKQKFNQWWVWLLLTGITGMFLFAVIRQVVMGLPVGNNPAPNELLVGFVIIPLLLIFFFLGTTLRTEINEEGISYRFFPFHLRYHQIIWEDVKEVEVREYSPLREFYGWGIRYSLTGSGWAYNIRGNQGIQIILKDDTKILIGTQKPEEAATVINMMKNRKAA